jgi:hypothetical protein
MIHRDCGTSIRVDEDHEFEAHSSASCGHMEEGPSADELRLGILGIASESVETLDHTNVEIPKG